MTETRPRRPVAKAAPADAAPRTCNVCQRPPEWRGLCAAHRATRRGDADPKGARL